MERLLSFILLISILFALLFNSIYAVDSSRLHEIDLQTYIKLKKRGVCFLPQYKNAVYKFEQRITSVGNKSPIKMIRGIACVHQKKPLGTSK